MRVALIYISLITNDAKPLFMYILVVCISLEKRQFKFFVHFKLSYLSFCCWVISSLYILDTRPFLNIWFAVVFKLMGYLSLFLIVAFEEQKILFWWSQLPFIFLWLHVLSVSCLKSQCFIQGPKALYLRFSLRFYSFSHYI